MTVNIENPEAIADIEEYMSRFGLSADIVVERLIMEAGTWMPMEVLAYEPRERTYSSAASSKVDE